MPESSDNWFHERESAWLYRQISAAEPDPRKQELFTALAAAAERQAERWERTHVQHAPFHPTWRARLVAGLLRTFGPEPLKPALAALKLRGLSVYDGKARKEGHPMPQRVAHGGHRRRGGADDLGPRPAARRRPILKLQHGPLIMQLPTDARCGLT